MNPLIQKLIDASESLATPMHSTNQASQHTPGPWTFGDKHGKRPLWELIYDSHGSHLATVTQSYNHGLNHFGPDSNAEAEANARLIAAAPELLAALENLLAGPNWPGAQMTARATIARAKGQA